MYLSLLFFLIAFLGWDNWSEWSICDENKEQHRKRACKSLNPGPNMCKGKSIETRMCVNGKKLLEYALYQ